ncbi:MAG TPA: YihY/virulence factor BrkB family protein [Actinomycetota bacterium]|nr:YihY/virulence factor BrkB family protein [Actinomycetota bacterium]
MDRLRRIAALAKLQLEKARASSAVVDVVVRTFKRFSEDDGGTHTAALTYYTFFSIFPLLLFSASALGYVTFGDADLQDRLVESGLKTVPILKDALTPRGLAILQERRGGLALTATALAVYTGSGVIVALQHALNRIWRVDTEPTFLVKRAKSLAWLVVLGLGAAASLVLSTIAGLAPARVAAVLTLIAALAVNTGLFTAAFRFLPTIQRPWRDLLPGALVAAIGFELLKLGGSMYLRRGEDMRNATFGVFATAAALLVASFLIARVILMAAEVNAVLVERRTTRESSGPT